MRISLILGFSSEVFEMLKGKIKVFIIRPLKTIASLFIKRGKHYSPKSISKTFSGFRSPGSPWLRSKWHCNLQ